MIVAIVIVDERVCDLIKKSPKDVVSVSVIYMYPNRAAETGRTCRCMYVVRYYVFITCT